MSLKYRAEIDGLRALAVLPVVFYHANIWPFTGGFVGVDVFFVISGYLIASIILSDIDKGNFSLRHFYARRARRILPALFFVMLISLPFAWLVMMPADFENYLDSLLAASLFYSNIHFYGETGYFATAAEFLPFLHTWSLAVEEQFYLFFPLLLMASWRRAQGFAIVGLIFIFALSLGLSEFGVRHDPVSAYFLLPYRVWELLAGSGLAIWMRQSDRPLGQTLDIVWAAIGLAFVLFPIFAYKSSTPFPGVAALLPVVGTLLLLRFATQSNAIGQAMAARPLVAVGLVSYGLYLWHVPVFALFRLRFGLEAFETAVWWLIAFAGLGATLSYWLVERPLRFRASSWMFGSVLAGTFVGLVSTGIWLDKTIADHPQSLPSYRWALENGPAEWVAYAQRQTDHMHCKSKNEEFGYRECAFGAVGQEQSLVIWGDSLAWSMLDGLDHYAKAAGLSGRAYYVPGCPPLLGLTNELLPQECTADTHREILSQIEALPPGQTVILWGVMAIAFTSGHINIDGKPVTGQEVRKQTTEMIARLADHGSRAFLIEPGPFYPTPVALTLLQNLRQDELFIPTIPRAEYLAHVKPVRDAIADLPGYVPVLDYFCNAMDCPSIDEQNRIVIYDKVHLSVAHSALFTKFVTDAILATATLEREGLDDPLNMSESEVPSIQINTIEGDEFAN